MAPASQSRFDPDATTPDASSLAASWALPPPSGIIGTSRALTSETSSLNGLRKRSSLFGRSQSDAGSMRRATATSHTPKSSLSSVRLGEEAVRPTPANTTESRRRKTDPLQSIRDSIFGGKKKPSRDATDAPSSRPGSSGAAQVQHADRFFDTEEDYYRHRSKHSISPPFNFQHVTHTTRNQVPQLETVDEKDLSAEFWSVAAYQRPRRRLHGIKVDKLDTKHRQMGLIRESEEHPRPFSPPTSPTSVAGPLEKRDDDTKLISPVSPFSPLDSTIMESEPRVSQSAERSNSEASLSASHNSASLVARHPKRFSSLGVLNQSFQTATQPTAAPGPAAPTHLGSQESFYDSRSSSSEGEAQRGQQGGDEKLPMRKVPELNASMPPNFSSEDDIAFRLRQPLPSLPPQVAGSTSSPGLLQLQHTKTSMLSPTIPAAKPRSLKSKRSSKSSQSTRRSQAASQSSVDLRANTSFSVSDVSWEDSIDLAYEEEAEATCDFAWDESKPKRLSGAEKPDSAATAYHAESPNLSNASGSAFSEQRSSSNDTIAELGGEGPHKRGTSVGHRGFLAARKNSSTPDLLAKAREPPAPLTLSQNSTQVSVLSPVFSVAEENTTKSPFTPADLHYPRIERVSNDYLSDPESYRNSHGSRHRKSSSYGSYGSYDSAGTRAGPPNSSSNPTRWSIASAGSMPELMHSRPKSKSSLSRSMVSQPLDPLPQSPPDSGKDAEFMDIPRSQPAAETTASLRRSAHSTDRVMQAAGRAVQRGRPGSYARYSQHLEPQDVPPRGGVRESWVAGPEWI